MGSRMGATAVTQPGRSRNDVVMPGFVVLSPRVTVTASEHPTSRPGPLPRVFAVLFPLLAGAMILAGVYGLIVSLGRPELIVHPEFSALLRDLRIPSSALITVGLFVPLLSASALAVAVWIGRRRDWRAMVFSLGVLGIMITGARATFVIASTNPGMTRAMMVTDVAAILSIVGLVFLFPTGTFRPRWGGWLAAVVTVIVLTTPDLGQMVGLVMTGETPAPRASVRMFVFLAVLLIGGGAAQTIRFRRDSSEGERNHIKWVLLPFGLLLVCVSIFLPTILIAETTPIWIAPLILFAAGVGSLLPVTVGIALFRHHLYDVDRVISRTITYGVVVLALIGIYAGTVLVLGSLFPGEGALSVAASTLVTVAALSPLRRRVQGVVDRRFYRAHYDAELIADELSASVRDELNVAQLERMLIEVVDRAFKPSFAAVWVRASDE